jgi:hypothetical protein
LANEVNGPFTPSGPLTVVTTAIAVTPDTIKAVLHERRGGVSGGVVAGFLGIAITIWAAYFSATFHDALGISAAVIESIFLIAGVLASLATAATSVAYLSNRKRCSVESIVEEITERSKKKT